MLSKNCLLLALLIALSVSLAHIGGTPTRHHGVDRDDNNNFVSVQQSGGGVNRAIVNGQVYENGVRRPAEYGATGAADGRSGQHSGNQRNVAQVNVVGQRNNVGISQS